jgi:hypothetical protein
MLSSGFSPNSSQHGLYAPAFSLLRNMLCQPKGKNAREKQFQMTSAR